MSSIARVALILLSVFGFGARDVLAANSGVTYQGRILKPDGSPLAGSSAQFKLQIRTPDAGNCLMYEEIQAQDMSRSNGAFSLTINDGTGTRTDTTALTLDKIFANRGTFNIDQSTCATGTGVYSPNATDGRNLAVLFKDETMSSWEPIPAQKINFVPFAFEAKQVQGFTADSLLKVVDGSGNPQTGISPLSNAQYSALIALANGTSSAYTATGTLNGFSLPTMTSGQVLGWNGSTWISTSPAPAANSITSAMLQASSVTSSAIASGAIGTSQIAANVSINTSGTLAARDIKIYPAGSGTGFVEMQASSSIADGTSYLLKWPATAGAANQVLTTDGSGVLSWANPAASGLGGLSGDVTASGTGTVAATVNSVGGSTAALVHSAELAANAAVSTNTASTLIKRDTGGNFAAGAASVGSVAYRDSSTGTITISAPSTVTSYSLKWPATVAGSAGQVLSSDASGNLSWTTPATSAAPSGSASGDLSGTYPNPSVAAVGTSTATLIHSAELAANSATATNTSSKIVTRDGSGNFAANVATLNGLSLNNAGSLLTITNPSGGAWNMTLPATAGASGQVMATNGSGVMNWISPLTSSSAFINGGNSFGAVSSVGNNDNFDLAVKTNGTTRMTIAASGSVGVGTTAPFAQFHLNRSTPLGFPSNHQLQLDDNSALSNSVTNSQLYIRNARATVSGHASISLDKGLTGAGATVGFLDAGVSQWDAGVTDDDNFHIRDTVSNNKIFNLAQGAPAGSFNIDSAGRVGIGTTAPSGRLHLAAGASAAGGAPFKLTAGPNLTTPEAGAIEFDGTSLFYTDNTNTRKTLGVAGSGITALTGDVTATGSGSATATVAQVGGVTAANVASGANLANAGTAANTASTLVKRDASGNFAAGAATLSSASVGSVVYKDSGSGTVSLSAPTTVSSSYSMKWPAAIASAGQVLTSDASGNLSWTTPSTTASPTGTASGDLSGSYPGPSVSTVGTSTAANIHTAELAANGATSANTASKLVARDPSGNFAANVATVNGLALTNAASTLNIVNPTGGAWTLTLPATAGASGQVMQTNGSGTMSWATPVTSATAFVNGGDSFGASSSIGNNDNFDLSIKTNNASRVTVTAGGNVGIGTTAPPVPFVISTTGTGSGFGVHWNQSGGTGETDFYNYGQAGSGGFRFFNYAANGAAWPGTGGTQLMNIDSSGRLIIGSGLGQSKLDVAGGVAIGSYAGSVAAPANGLIVSGNVGIGTTAPSAVLNIKAGTASAGSAPLKFTAGTLLSTPEDGAMEATSSGLYYTIGSTRYVIPTNSSAGNYSNVSTISNSTGSITMSPMSGNSVIVNASTVSTSSSTGALIVNGGVGVAGAINSAGNITSGGSITASTNAVLPQIYGSSAASGTIKIDGTSNATSGNVLLATAGGSVGVGTTAPTAAFDVAAAGSSSLQAWHTADGTQTSYIDNYGTWHLGNNGAGNYNFMIVGNGAAYGTAFIAQNFNGNNAPGYANSAGGDLNLTSGLATGNATSGNIYFRGAPVGSSGATSQTATTYVTVVGGGASAGNVGIGTTAPGSALSVVGQVRASIAGASPSSAASSYALALSRADGDTSKNLIWGGSPTSTFFSVSAQGDIFAFGGLNVGNGANIANGLTLGGSSRYISAVNASSNLSLLNQPPGAGSGQLTIGQAGETIAIMAGNVGIGTTAPTSTLEIKGTIVSDSTANTGAYLNMASGNMQVSSTSATTLNLCGLRDGAAYTVVLTGIAANTSVTVNGYSTYVNSSSCSGAATVDMGAGTTTFTTSGTTNILTFIYTTKTSDGHTLYGSATGNFNVQ